MQGTLKPAPAASTPSSSGATCRASQSGGDSIFWLAALKIHRQLDRAHDAVAEFLMDHFLDRAAVDRHDFSSLVILPEAHLRLYALKLMVAVAAPEPESLKLF